MLGGGGFSLGDVHARAEAYDEASEDFSFRAAAPPARADPRLFSLPVGSARAAVASGGGRLVQGGRLVSTRGSGGARGKSSKGGKLVSASTSALPSLRDVGGGGSNQQASAAEDGMTDDEVLARGALRVFENCGSAVLASDQTWRCVGRTEGACECPAMRDEVRALERAFALAMAQGDLAMSGKGADGGASSHISGGGGSSSAAKAATKAAVDLVSRDLMHLRGVAEGEFPGMLDDAKKAALTKLIFEQKWTDLVVGELQSQLLVSCLPQGRLLRDLRSRQALLVASARELHRQTVMELRECAEQLGQQKAQVRALHAARGDMEAAAAAKQQGRMAELEAAVTTAEQDRDARVAEAEGEVEKLNDTLKTLNNIFRQMRADGDGMRFADLKDAFGRLEGEVMKRNSELEKLRPMKVELQSTKTQLSVATMKVDSLEGEVARLREQLGQKEALCEELTRREAERLALAEMEEQEAAEGALGDGEQEDEDDAEHEDTSDNAKKERAERKAEAADWQRFEPVEGESLTDIADVFGFSVGGLRLLAMRVNAASDAVLDVRTREAKELGKASASTLPCSGYRLLLPNLLGFEPPRENGWVLACCRCIMRAKALADGAAGRAERLRPRFPEFVYAWFEPTEQELLEAGGMEAREAAVRLADEHRWGLYYGVKKLAKELPEAKLFHSLLAETHGEDAEVFASHCLKVLDGIGRASGSDGTALQWGPRNDVSSWTTLSRRVQLQGNGVEPAVVWADSRHCGAATAQVMSQATSEERSVVLKKIQERALPAAGRMDGLVAAAAANPDSKTAAAEAALLKVVDVFTWLTLMMKEYKEEQAHRRAAIRLMFNTAAAGSPLTGMSAGMAASSGSGSGGNMDGEAAGGPDAVPTLDMQQFAAMVMTLNSRTTAGAACALFRDASDAGDNNVTFRSFMRAAERHQFFSSCLRLPAFLGATQASELTRDQCIKLGSCVHRHLSFFRPNIEHTAQLLPVAVKMELAAALKTLDEALTDRPLEEDPAAKAARERETKQIEASESDSGAEEAEDENSEAKTAAELELALKAAETGSSSFSLSIDGRRGLCAYRRVLGLLIDVRLHFRESAGEPEGAHAVDTVDRELSALEGVLSDFTPTSRAGLFAAMRGNVAVVRVQRAWRVKLAAERAVPLRLRHLMSHGYGNGTDGGVRRRRALRPARWVMTICAQLAGARIADLAASAGGTVSCPVVYAAAPPPPRLKRRTPAQLEAAKAAAAAAAAAGEGGVSKPVGGRDKDPLACGKLPAGSEISARAHAGGFAHFVYEWFLQRFGTRALAEVQLHDFFVNLQLYASGSTGLGAELVEDDAKQEKSAAEAIGDTANSMGSALSVTDRCRTFACLLGARGASTVVPGGSEGEAANSTTGSPMERALAARAEAASTYYLRCLAMINQLVATEAAKGGTGVNPTLAAKAKKAKAGEGVGPLFPCAGEHGYENDAAAAAGMGTTISAALLAPIARLALGGNQFTQAVKDEGVLEEPGSDTDEEKHEVAQAAAKASGSTTVAEREEAFVNKARDKLLDKAASAAAAADGASTDVVVETDGLLWLLLGVWRAEAERRAVALRRAASGFCHAVSAKLMSEADFNNIVGAASPGMRAVLRLRLFNEVKRTCFEPQAAPKEARAATADPREHLAALQGAQGTASGVVLDEARFVATLGPWLMDGFKVLAPQAPPKRGTAPAAGAVLKPLSLHATGNASAPSAQLQILTSVWSPIAKSMEHEIEALREHLFTILQAQAMKEAAGSATDALGGEGESDAAGADDVGTPLTEAMLDAVAAKREALVAAMADMPLIPSDAKDAAVIDGAWESFLSLYHEICRLKTLGSTTDSTHGLGRVADAWDGAKEDKKKKKKKQRK